MTFKIGDEATWSSQANGSTKQKICKVIAVVHAGEYPRGVITREHLDPEYNVYTNDVIGALPRNHESYIVAVQTPKGKGRPHIYWPRVSALRPVVKD
jgi:hypothetical protein